MRNKFIFVLILTLMLGLLIVGCSNNQQSSNGNSSEELVLKVGHTSSEIEPYHEGILAMNEKLNELSDGKIRLDIYPNSTVGDERQMIEAVQGGDLDMVITSNTPLSNFSQDFMTLDLPFIFRDTDHAWNVLNGEIGEEISSNLPEKNMRVLSYFYAGYRHLMNNEKPINSIEDLEGLKVRVVLNPIHLDAFTAYGANPTPLSYNELYTGLQQGVVEGAEAANTNYLQQNLYEVADHWAQIGWMHLISELIINEELYSSLTTEQQDILQEAALYAAEIEWEIYIQKDQDALEELKELGVQITEPDRTPFIEISEQIWEEYADQSGGMDRIQRIQEVE